MAKPHRPGRPHQASGGSKVVGTKSAAEHGVPNEESLARFAPVLHVMLMSALAWGLLSKHRSPGKPYTLREIEYSADASQLAAEALTALSEKLQPGVTTADVDNFAHEFLSAHNATAETWHYGGVTGGLLRPEEPGLGRTVCHVLDRGLGILRRAVWLGLPALPFCGFPGHLCVSINEEVCHGIPSADRTLQEGDLVKLDIAARRHGFVGDTCATFVVGSDAAADPRALHLSEVAREALFLGMFAAVANRTLGDIGHAIQAHAEAEGFQIVTTFGGHGVGRRFHEPPLVMHTGRPGEGHKLEEGQIFTIEPMLTEGSSLTTVTGDGWTVITRDGSLSAQWEHTIALVGAGTRILSLRQGEKMPNRLADGDRRARLLSERYDNTFAEMLDSGAIGMLATWPNLAHDPAMTDPASSKAS